MEAVELLVARKADASMAKAPKCYEAKRAVDLDRWTPLEGTEALFEGPQVHQVEAEARALHPVWWEVDAVFYQEICATNGNACRTCFFLETIRLSATGYHHSAGAVPSISFSPHTSSRHFLVHHRATRQL